MAIKTRISNEVNKRLAPSDTDRKWELSDGEPREKPGMSAAQIEAALDLGHMPRSQLDRRTYRVRVDLGKARRPGATNFVL